MMCYANLVSAGVAELADAHDSKSCGAIRAGSSPATGMIRKSILWASFFLSFFPGCMIENVKKSVDKCRI